MKYIEFDEKRPMDLVLLGRVAIDFNPAYNDQVKEEFKPLKNVHVFEKFVGGSPANIAVGVTKHGLKAGFKNSGTVGVESTYPISSISRVRC